MLQAKKKPRIAGLFLVRGGPRRRADGD